MEGGCIGMVNSSMSKSTVERINSYFFKKSKILEITDDTFFIVFERRSELDLNYYPGQFCMIATPESLTRKPFTLGMYDGSMSISVKVVGNGSKYIVTADEEIDILGPLGKPFAPENKNGAVLVAPSCFAEGFFISEYFNVPLFVSSKVPFKPEFIKRFESEKISFFVGNESYLKLVNELNLSNFDWIFVSGSKTMELLAFEHLKNKKTYFSLNEYMGCGLGACKSCAVETVNGMKHVCTEGPVFRGDEIWKR